MIKPTLAVAALISPLLASPARAAPAVRGSAAATAHKGALTIARPHRAVRGDVLLAVITIRRGRFPIRFSLPHGWHAARRDAIAGGTLLQIVAYRVVGAHDPPAYRFRLRHRPGAAGGLVAIQGANRRHPIRATAAVLARRGARSLPVPRLSAMASHDLGIVASSTVGASHVHAPRGMRSVLDRRTSDGRASVGAAFGRRAGGMFASSGLRVALSMNAPVASVVASVAVEPRPAKHAAAKRPAAKHSRSGGVGARPYAASSPWNKPISKPRLSPKSSSYVRAIANNGTPLTSDPDQYSMAVYVASASTPMATVTGRGSFSSYDGGDSSRRGHGSPWSVRVPVPSAAKGGAGSDGQILILDKAHGIEYGFWQFSRQSAGHYQATNGYRYHTSASYNGRFADGRAGRGAGTPYLAGLVRPWEISQGHIDHALAFGYHSPAHAFVYPASKSDGAGKAGTDLPEGSHLQLDPSLTNAYFKRLGLSATAKIIAHALQRYGMYVVDNSGASKVYLEARTTAHWGSGVNRKMLSRIPWSKFRVITR